MGNRQMFEPPAAASITSRANLARVFRVIAFIGGINAALILMLGDTVYAGIVAALSAGLWVTADGLDERKRWARWMGHTLGAGFLLVFSGVGIVIGAAIFIALWRASRAGAFAAVGSRG